MIDLTIHEDTRKKTIQRCREQGIILPSFAQMKDPASHVPPAVLRRLEHVGLWDVDPVNLFRITWNNEPKYTGGGFGGPNYIELPPSLTGVQARILALVGKYFPTGAHKVGATYGCLAPALVTGNFDPTRQKAVWPSTGNYCRGGAYNSALLGCDSIAILPEEMSRERFEWLKQVAGEVIATKGSESNVKEIFDACHELIRDRGDEVVIFNQFDQFGNYLWHYEVTAAAIENMLKAETKDPQRVRGFLCSTGSAGTIGAADYLKPLYPAMTTAAGEALQCPTLLCNGFGEHRIEGIGDKHVPWVHNVKHTDMVIAIDDHDCMDLLRLFNCPLGKEYLEEQGVPVQTLEKLSYLGISGIGNLLGAIKLAKYYELEEDDIVVTVLTDSMEMYASRIEEVDDARGAFTRDDAAVSFQGTLLSQRTDHMMELSYRERKRIHNLKYYTWVEQQQKDVEELKAQWYDRYYWENIQKLTGTIDELIHQFNTETGLQ